MQSYNNLTLYSLLSFAYHAAPGGRCKARTKFFSFLIFMQRMNFVHYEFVMEYQICAALRFVLNYELSALIKQKFMMCASQFVFRAICINSLR